MFDATLIEGWELAKISFLSQSLLASTMSPIAKVVREASGLSEGLAWNHMNIATTNYLYILDELFDLKLRCTKDPSFF